MGEANAWYDEAVITVCYLDEIWKAANARKRPEYVAPDDAFMGPFVDTILHEAGHAGPVCTIDAPLARVQENAQA